MADFSKSRGPAAMESKKGVSATSFCPFIGWKDKEMKYVTFLTPAAEVTTVHLHDWIPVGESKNGKTINESFIDRRDPCIGEDADELTDRLGHQAKKRTLAVAIELEPLTEKVGTRTKVTKFEVKQVEFTRTNEAGDEEDVTAPVVGIVTQAKANFYGWLGSFDETNEPIEDTPFQVKRNGGDKDTQYNFVPLIGTPIDYTNLIEGYQNIFYIRELEPEGDTDKEKALSLGDQFLNMRLEALADKDRYDTLVGPLESVPDKWGTGGVKAPSSDGPSFDEIVPEVEKDDKIEQLKRKFAKANS